MSASRQKGTAYETYVLNEYLRRVWPAAERAALRGQNDYGDFTNVDGWLVEAKKRARLRGEIVGWVNRIVGKVLWKAHTELQNMGAEFASLREKEAYAAATLPWMLIMAGDRRTEPRIDLVVMPATHLFSLLAKNAGPDSMATVDRQHHQPLH